MRINPKACAVCATPLTTLQARSAFLCGNVLCTWKYNRVPEAQRCAVCHRELTVSEMAQRTCSSAPCRRAWTVDRHHDDCRTREQLLQVNATAFRDECVPAAGLLEGAAFPVFVVPFNSAIEADLPNQRREGLREHLVGVILKATVMRDAAVEAGTDDVVASDYQARRPPAFPPPSPEMDSVMISACMACRGYCCTTGGEHAYLTPHTMLRYLRVHPQSSAEDIVETYLSHLVSRTMSNGCVYQGAEGCVLPRELRSDTCNQFFCGSLHNFRNRMSRDTSLRAFFAPTEDTEFEHGVFAAPGYVQIVRANRARPEPVEV